MNTEERVSTHVDRNHLTQDRVQWRNGVNTTNSIYPDAGYPDRHLPGSSRPLG